MKILADLHHADLAESLELLFTDRFGWDVYFPIGMGWFDRWFWNFERAAHGDAVARQYLVGVWPEAVNHGDHWTVDDPTHPGRVRKGVELDQALSQEWDIVLCSLTHNEQAFARLAVQVGAHYGVQVGNVGQVQNVAGEGAGWDATEFALLSTTTAGVHVPKPHVIYRQEFSLKDFRYEWPPANTNSVASFIQCFPENGPFYEDFLHFAREYPTEFDWKVYGAYGTAPSDEFACGNLPSTPDVARGMRDTRTAWHAKWWSDGYGHVVHNLAAVGRPKVGPLGYYEDKLAGPLHVDGVTSWDTNHRTNAEVVDILRKLRDDDDFHEQTCEAVRARFDEVVNFDEDAENVKALLESL
jgi:hypothetical protein